MPGAWGAHWVLGVEHMAWMNETSSWSDASLFDNLFLLLIFVISSVQICLVLGAQHAYLWGLEVSSTWSGEGRFWDLALQLTIVLSSGWGATHIYSCIWLHSLFCCIGRRVNHLSISGSRGWPAVTMQEESPRCNTQRCSCSFPTMSVVSFWISIGIEIQWKIRLLSVLLTSCLWRFYNTSWKLKLLLSFFIKWLLFWVLKSKVRKTIFFVCQRYFAIINGSFAMRIYLFIFVVLTEVGEQVVNVAFSALGGVISTPDASVYDVLCWLGFVPSVAILLADSISELTGDPTEKTFDATLVLWLSQLAVGSNILLCVTHIVHVIDFECSFLSGYASPWTEWPSHFSRCSSQGKATAASFSSERTRISISILIDFICDFH